MADSGFGDFPEIAGADRQAERAVLLLEQAAADARRAGDGHHGWAARAQVLRGAVAMAQTAVAQIAVTAGWNEAADAANRGGLLDLEEPLDTDAQAMTIKHWDKGE
jgi:hypothetical protein